ncbi:MAG TPA: trypsin-like peptidase domain-containing protein [Myxococcota bacterium]
MKRPVVLALLLSTALTSTSALADRSLWTERNSGPKVAIPSLAPLVKDSEAAVLSITVESTAQSSVDPRMLRRFGLEMPDLKQQGQGTGFLIHPDGYALTNHHVVEGATRIQVRVGGRSEVIEAKVIGDDPRTDVALIKLEGRNPAGGAWTHLPLGNSDALNVGDFVVAIGNPFGLSQSVSMGILSAKSRRDIAPSGRQGLYDFLQTDASINPGNSGGPLLNLNGEVIGINSAVNAAGQGIGFAIPVNLVKSLLPDLRAKGRVSRAWIGVGVQRVNADIADGLGLERPRGALVTQVVKGGPAYKAGLEPGDVITKFDGKTLEDSSDLPLLATMGGIGRSIPIELVRNGETRSAKVTLAAMPGEDEAPALDKLGRTAEDPKTARLGVRVNTLDDDLRARLDLSGKQRGAVIVRVEPGSAAATAGLAPGDVVTDVNGATVVDADSFTAAVSKVKSGKLLKMLVLRGGTTTFVAMPRP